MKIITIGDIHGRPIWKKIVADNPDTDTFIFVGDYFDSFDYSAAEQIYNFKEIIEFKKANFLKVILLLGNHDVIYFPKTLDLGIEGFNISNLADIQKVLLDNQQYLQMCYQADNYLFTHAGVSETFLKDTYYPDGDNFSQIPAHLNALWKISPKDFSFKPGWDKYGNSPNQSCIWIRPQALMIYNKKLKKSGLVQIVGHTFQNQIDIKGKATGKRYYFIDTLGTSGEYLVIENNIITSKVIKNEPENL